MVRRALPVLALLVCLWSAAPAAASDPFSGTGMWIWQLARSEHGDVGALAARAKAAGVDTLIIKGANATQRTGSTCPR